MLCRLVTGDIPSTTDEAGCILIDRVRAYSSPHPKVQRFVNRDLLAPFIILVHPHTTLSIHNRQDPEHFSVILNFLRTGRLASIGNHPTISYDSLLDEAMFFQLQALVDMLQPSCRADLSRKDIVLNRYGVVSESIYLSQHQATDQTHSYDHYKFDSLCAYAGDKSQPSEVFD